MKQFYSDNRKALGDQMKDQSMLILFAGNAPKKSADASYDFTPNRHFYYMTGIDEENIILTVVKNQGEIKETLFIKERDALLVKWVGETVSPDEAKEKSGVDNIKFLDAFEAHMHQVIYKEGCTQLYLDLEKDSYEAKDSRGVDFGKEIKNKYPQIKMENIFNEISELRVLKKDVEVENLKKAIKITGEGIYNLMKNTKAGMKEYELEAYFDFILKKSGVKDFAFTTICASGHNATVLHYVDNNAVIKEGDLVLLDLGAQYGYYNGDISRTFPVSGKFTNRQKAFYDLVLKAHDQVIAMVKPGIPYSRINELVQEIYAKGLRELGLIQTDEEVRKYYYHNTSHFLGLDTHDVGKREVILEEGMVITVEPGLYIEEESIGIRLEDDILITKDGCENLSKEIIIKPEDIEAFLAKKINL